MAEYVRCGRPEAVDDTTPNYVFIKYLKLATVPDGH